jgi:two-component system phosphate regulon sensor histidine kinase PhoR
VFINLIDNAIKYTERGEVVISLSHNNETVQIEIQDTGIGIPREHLSRIFERFYVVDSSRSRKLGGTGLGLSIVKHIVLLHNGKIDVKNIPGTGTNFIVTLPVYPNLARPELKKGIDI